jgi:hypothetical protein
MTMTSTAQNLVIFGKKCARQASNVFQKNISVTDSSIANMAKMKISRFLDSSVQIKTNVKRMTILSVK